MTKASLAVVSCCALLAIAGCGSADQGNRPPRHPVAGVVTYKDRPLAEAQVSFVPTAGGPAAFAQTDDAGRYRLTTFEAGDGAVDGSYAVTVTKLETPPAPPAPAGGEYVPPPDNPKPSPPPKSLIPKKYGTAGTSGLTATVKEGENVFDFPLTD